MGRRLGRSVGLALVGVLVLSALFLPACATIKEWVGPDPTLELTPDSAPRHWERAMEYRKAGDLAHSAEELELAVRADPDMYHAWYMLGLTYKALGDLKRAKAVWQLGAIRAENGPERKDYPRQKALAQMRAGLMSLSPPAGRRLRRSKPSAQKRKTAAKARGKVKPSAKASRGWAVLFSSNLRPVNARRDAARLKRLGYRASIKPHRLRGKKWYRVWVGCCTSRAKARALAHRLERRGIGRGLTVMRP